MIRGNRREYYSYNKLQGKIHSYLPLENGDDGSLESDLLTSNIKTMEFLGTYKITLNTQDIEVDCWGACHKKQVETLEQEGIPAYNELERVKHADVDITDYLSDDLFGKLSEMVNEK
jgi:hypothetical protein